MNDDLHINGAVSALVMLAAIASTWGIYSTYKDAEVAYEYEEVQNSLEQTASALLALRLQAQTTDMTSTTTEAATEEIESVQ